jgi:hypothetical protein
MSKIDTLIQQLQEKKKKLDYLEYIKDLLKGDQKCIDFLEVQEEVLNKLIPMITQLSSEIEDSVETSAPAQASNGTFSASELAALRLIASKVTEKSSQVQQPAPKAPQQNTNKDNLPPQDKMNFAMENRHLAAKKVRVLHKETNEPFTTGTVVGLDAPYVIVKTVEGHTISVPTNKILMGETA